MSAKLPVVTCRMLFVASALTLGVSGAALAAERVAANCLDAHYKFESGESLANCGIQDGASMQRGAQGPIRTMTDTSAMSSKAFPEGWKNDFVRNTLENEAYGGGD